MAAAATKDRTLLILRMRNPRHLADTGQPAQHRWPSRVRKRTFRGQMQAKKGLPSQFGTKRVTRKSYALLCVKTKIRLLARRRTSMSYLSAANVDGISAVDGELRSVDVGRAIGRDEHDSVGNLAHGPPAARDDAPVTTGLIEELLL